jgi:hypothetical protein
VSSVASGVPRSSAPPSEAPPVSTRSTTSSIEAPSNWWTPLLSSGGSGKVSNEPGTASFYG